VVMREVGTKSRERNQLYLLLRAVLP
jgi:hypothetical protein